MVYKVLEWISKMAFLNILWITFTLLGVVIFGFFPATVALLMVLRDIRSGNEKSLFTSFLHYFVQNFPIVNVYGFIVVIVNIIAISLSYLASEGSSIIVTLPLYGMTLLIFVISLFVFPVFSYFEASFFNHIKLATILALGHPIPSFILFTLFMINVGIIIYSNILIMFPFLFLFFMISGSFFLVMTILLPVFKKVEESISLESFDRREV